MLLVDFLEELDLLGVVREVFLNDGHSLVCIYCLVGFRIGKLSLKLDDLLLQYGDLTVLLTLIDFDLNIPKVVLLLKLVP
jgi:hypothetical protein